MGASLKGALFALLAFAVYASHDALIKLLGASYAPMQILFFVALFSFPLILLMLLRDRTEGTLIPRHPGWTFLRTAAVAFGSLGGFYAFSALPLAQVYAILFAMPLLITALSVPILGEVVHLRRWIAVGVGLIGVIIVLQPGQVSLSLGHAAALLGALSSALAFTIVRKIGESERVVVQLVYPLLGQFLVAGAALPFVYVPMQGGDLALVAFIALLSYTAMLLLIWAYRTASASVVAPMQYSQILWAAFFGVLLFDEWPGWNTALGAGFVIASGLYILVRESTGPSTHRPVSATRSRSGPGADPRIGLALRAERTEED